MKYLKYFESVGKASTQMGLTEEEVRECFYDLSDEGWLIVVKFSKRMMSPKVDRDKGQFNADLIPYLEVKIYKRLPAKATESEMEELQNSEVYKGCFGSLIGRLDDNNLFVKNHQVERNVTGGSQIFILIYRKSDENYLR